MDKHVMARSLTYAPHSLTPPEELPRLEVLAIKEASSHKDRGYAVGNAFVVSNPKH